MRGGGGCYATPNGNEKRRDFLYCDTHFLPVMISKLLLPSFICFRATKLLKFYANSMGNALKYYLFINANNSSLEKCLAERINYPALCRKEHHLMVNLPLGKQY